VPARQIVKIGSNSRRRARLGMVQFSTVVTPKSMNSKHLGRLICSISAGALLMGGTTIGLGAGADAIPLRRHADVMKQKVAAINQLGERPQKVRRRTTVTESELNAYLALEVPRDLPTGVVNPSVTILESGRLSGRAIVDLDAVRKESPPKSLLDPKNLLIGRLPITATGVLTTSNGVGRFALESASLGGLPVPKALLQEILSFYSRTPDKPAGISLDDPFAMPVRIREIQVSRGQAIVVQ
jgi:hypothetical protein